MTAPREIPGLSSALEQDVYAHSFGSTDHEVGGVLVGTRNPHGPPNVEGSIRAQHAAENVSELTFTQDTWGYIHTAIERDYPWCEIVGWYHTHPGYGLFLSQQDRFIHRNFFQNRGQIALVIDPVAGEEAVYRWSGDEIVEHYRQACAAPPRTTSGASARRGPTRPASSAPAMPGDDRSITRTTGPDPTPGDAAATPRAWIGFIQINPETSRPTLVSTIYLIAIGLSIGTVVWELFFR